MPIEDTEKAEFVANLALAQSEFQKGNYAQAEPALREALHELESNDTAIPHCLKNLSYIEASRGNFPEAIRLQLRLLAVAQSSKQDEKDQIGIIMHLANLYEADGRLNEAEYMRGRAQGLHEKKITADDGGLHGSEFGDLADGNEHQPLWLQDAFAEANRLYGKQPVAPDPKVVRYVPPEDKPHAFRSLSDMPDTPPQRPASARPDPPAAPNVVSHDKEAAFKMVEGRGAGLKSDNAHRSEDLHALVRSRMGSMAGAGNYENPQEMRQQIESQEGGGARNKRDAVSKIKTLDTKARRLAVPSGPSVLEKFLALLGSLQRRLQTQSGAAGDDKSKFQRQSGMLLPAVFVLFVIATVCVAGWYFFGRSTSASLMKVGEKYQSFDHDKLFCLVSEQECEFNAGPKGLRTPYKVFSGQPRDFVDVTVGMLTEKQYWMIRTPRGLFDPDGTILYRVGSGDLKLAKVIDITLNEASAYYRTQSKYPAKFSKEQTSALTYDNPFSRKKEAVKLQHLEVGDKASTDDPEFFRDHLYNLLRQGQGWQGRPKLHPGCVYCCSIAFHSKKGKSNLFVVQAADKQSNPYTGSLSKQCYFAALEDGQVHADEVPTLPFEKQKSVRAPVTWVLLGSDFQFLEILEHGPIYIAILMTMIFLFLFQLGRSRLYLILSIASMVAAGVYIAASLLP